jgi:hypothetical protein
LRSWIASIIDSSTVSPGKEVGDLEGARDAALHALVRAHRVMRSLAEEDLARAGSSTPVSRLMSVVLPAPLGR